MRVVFDLDGVLCHNGKPEDYANALPIQNHIDDFNKMVAAGNEVIIHTSRLAEDLPLTLKWLDKHGVKYSKVYCDKPKADLYIDDKASQFVPNLGAELDRKKLAICMSGGMDSYIAYWWAIKELGLKPDEIVNVHFDLGHPYAQKEKMALDGLPIKYVTFHLDLIRPELQNVPDEEHYIIPGRNMNFSSIAAGFGEKVWIMGMKFENHHLMFDKNDVFFNYATIALSQALGAQTEVESPFINLTKTDIINWALKHGVPDLDKTTSCYHPTEFRCGYCSLCFKRWIAMKACNVDEQGYATPPYKSEEAKRLVKAYKEAITNNDFSHYQKDRVEETLKIMEAYPFE